MAENGSCLLCQQPANIKYGEWLQYRKYRFHYLCLLLSPALYVKADETNGLYGFLGKDVVKEESRINKQRCNYCMKVHASLSCVVAVCKRSFHIECGWKRGCQYRLTDWQTLCHEHRSLEKRKRHEREELCVICCDELGDFAYNESIYANCCQESWYHHKCLAQMADRAGYFFRCPLCKNEEEFRKQVKEQGVFVPDRDAAWETELNAFAEQLERPNRCTAKRCLSTRSRSYNPPQGTLWNIITCHACGGQGIHKPCWGDDSPFICNNCSEMGANALLSDCLKEPALSDRSQKLLDKMLPCAIQLDDIRDIHMANNRSKKYFSGKWIFFSRLRGFDINVEKSSQVAMTTSQNDTSPNEITKEETDNSGFIRIPIPSTSKRLHDGSDNESTFSQPPLKKFKSDESFMDQEVVDAILRKTFLETESSSDNISSEDSEAGNQPFIANRLQSSEFTAAKRRKTSVNLSPVHAKSMIQLTLESYFKRHSNSKDV